jgi:hypothetical protein
MMLHRQALKVMSRYPFQQLRENSITMGHGLNLLAVTVFGGTSIVTTQRDSSLFIACLWDSSGSDWIYSRRVSCVNKVGLGPSDPAADVPVLRGLVKPETMAALIRKIIPAIAAEPVRQ